MILYLINCDIVRNCQFINYIFDRFQKQHEEVYLIVFSLMVSPVVIHVKKRKKFALEVEYVSFLLNDKTANV